MFHLQEFSVLGNLSLRPIHAAQFIPSLLRRFPQVSNLQFSLMAEDSMTSFKELAKLREITLHECRLDMQQLSQFVTPIFQQDVVNVERLTVYMDVTDGTSSMPVSSRQLTELVRGILRRESGGNFCVNFTDNVLSIC